MKFDRFDTHLGPILVAGDEQGLRYVRLLDDAEPDPGWCRNRASMAPVVQQLREYLGGQRHQFQLKLAPRGTPFQQRVWSVLCDIPYGNTWSYRDLAVRLGQPKAFRAVGGANGRNPIPIVVPCHRVIAADGGLGGYSLGSDLKRRLLQLEGAPCPITQAQLPI